MPLIATTCFLFLLFIFEIVSCEGFEFLLMFGNVFSQCPNTEENVRYAAKTLNAINKYKEEIKSENDPPILFYDMGNYLESSEFNPQEHTEVLQFFDLYKEDVVVFNKHGLYNNLQLLNRTSQLINETKSYYDKIINSGYIIKAKYHTVGVVDCTAMKKTDQSYIFGEETFPNEIDYVKRRALKLRKLGVDIIVAICNGDLHLCEEITEIEDVAIVMLDSKRVWLKMQNRNVSFVNIANYNNMQDCESIKYLEILKIEFDEEGLQKFQQKFIFLDDVAAQSKEVLDVMRPISREKRSTKYNRLLGESIVELSRNCRTAECSLGNMVTDAMTYHASKKKWSSSWTEYPIALVCSLIFKNNLPTRITKESISRAIRDYNLWYVSITGRMLKTILWKKMLLRFRIQFSGIHIYYKGRIIPRGLYITVRCGDCSEPKYTKLEFTKTYKVLMDGILAPLFIPPEDRKQGGSIRDIVAEYITMYNLTYHHVEGRYLEVSEGLLTNLERSKSSTFCIPSISYFIFFVVITSCILYAH